MARNIDFIVLTSPAYEGPVHLQIGGGGEDVMVGDDEMIVGPAALPDERCLYVRISCPPNLPPSFELLNEIVKAAAKHAPGARLIGLSAAEPGAMVPINYLNGLLMQAAEKAKPKAPKPRAKKKPDPRPDDEPSDG